MAEQAIQRSEQRYRQIVNTCEEGVWLCDADSRTTFVNRQMCAMLGYSAQEIVGRSFVIRPHWIVHKVD